MSYLRWIGLYALAIFALVLYRFELSALVWPTANPAFNQGQAIESYIQATVSKDPKSGLYGMVRNRGKKFHEGIDLFGLKFDAKREALDSIYAVFPGRVAYINDLEYQSGYGRYIVLLHSANGFLFYSLYAHLHSIESGIKVGMKLDEGAVIGRMGRSAGGYTIPKERAHLHFEIGLRYSKRFESWYQDQSFPNENFHGIWNGLNLFGVDPLDFYQSVRSGAVVSFSDYLKSLPIFLRIQIPYAGLPDFVQENPAFVIDTEVNRSNIAGWELDIARFGVPVKWRALEQSELDARANGAPLVISCYSELAQKFPLDPVLFEITRGEALPSSFLKTKLEKLFIQSD